MISPILIGGFLEMDRALLYIPLLVWRSRSDIRAKNVLDDPIKIKSEPEIRGSQFKTPITRFLGVKKR